MAKGQVSLKEYMEGIRKESSDDKSKETTQRAKIRSLAESMGSSIPATGIISRVKSLINQ